jgi:hypothetical protein
MTILGDVVHPANRVNSATTLKGQIRSSGSKSRSDGRCSH